MKFKRLKWASLLIITILISSAAIEKEDFSPLPWYNGLLNGDFHIEVSQGSLEGSYKNNQKVGNWILYDNNGKITQERAYNNNYEYVLEDDSIEAAKPLYELKRNKLGLYEYFDLDEDIILYSKRLWKVTDMYNFSYTSPMIRAFKEVDLSKVNVYATSELRKKHNLKKDQTIDFAQIINIKIMGDFFYDSKRKLSEYRVIAICPVLDNSELEYWFYYPDLRVTFGNMLIDVENQMIRNLDDLLFFDEYAYYIYKVENVQDTSFIEKDYKASTINVIKAQLESETSFWLKK